MLKFINRNIFLFCFICLITIILLSFSISLQKKVSEGFDYSTIITGDATRCIRCDVNTPNCISDASSCISNNLFNTSTSNQTSMLEKIILIQYNFSNSLKSLIDGSGNIDALSIDFLKTTSISIISNQEAFLHSLNDTSNNKFVPDLYLAQQYALDKQKQISPILERLLSYKGGSGVRTKQHIDASNNYEKAFNAYIDCIPDYISYPLNFPNTIYFDYNALIANYNPIDNNVIITNYNNTLTEFNTTASQNIDYGSNVIFDTNKIKRMIDEAIATQNDVYYLINGNSIGNKQLYTSGYNPPNYTA